MLKKLSGFFLTMMLLTALFAGLITAEAKTLLQITEQPSSVTAPSGSVAKVSFEAEGEGLTYSWYYKNAGASKFTRTTSFKGNTYSVEMNSSRNGRQIYCVVTDSDKNTVQTNTVKLNMGNPLTITKQPENKTAANGQTVKVSFSASGDGLTYKWYYKDAGKTSFSLTNTFKSNSYSVAMTNARSGRQLYCVVTDKYGTSVTTDTVTISITGALAITSQPKSVSVPCGETAKVSFTATGEGLTYKWYYKNPSAGSFSATSTFKSASYSVAMNSSRDGRQVYCVVTDKNGKSVKTDTVTLTAKHSFDSGKVQKKLTCTSDGVTLYTCKSCGFKNTETVKAEGHKLGSWKLILEPTVTSKGTERRSCQNCSYYKDRSIEMQTAVYTIKADYGNGNVQEIGVGENGAYRLSTPKKEGYTFKGWKDSLGNSFPSSGNVKNNIEISAVWEIKETKTIGELVSRAAAGADTIVITADITVNQAIYVPFNTTIYADGDYSLTRAPSYNGDFFVVGKDKYGTATVNLNKKAVLTLGGGKGTLTVDGNKENTTVDVVGTLVFTADSSEVNILDGVVLKNNKKAGNKRINTYSSIMAEETRFRVGGAAVICFSSTVNMYGGIIEGNEVATEYTEKTDVDGIITKHEYNGCGGAVYNRGRFNMYGGEIRDNLALRGGGIYTDRASFFYAGKISGNTATVYGAAISTSSTQNADTFIGTDDAEAPKMIIENNHALRAGGAIYSNTSSPIIIYGNTEFINNRTESSGGAIYTAGPLTIRGTLFKGNSCEYSGGAIYHHYTKLDFTPRSLKIENSTFEENSGGLGAAIILSASNESTESGTNATIKNCEFIKNHAIETSTNAGNGGAIYVTRKSTATITSCNFTENTANSNAGAIAVHSEANVTLKNIDFNGNSATFGGGIYTSSDSIVKLTDIDFTNNSAVLREDGTGGNGGAMNISGGSDVTLKTVSFDGNTAGNNAGAVYLNATALNVDSSCTFRNNSAGNHGGVFYLTYKTNADQTKTGSVLTAKDVIFENNSALSGGAVSARSASTLNLTNVKFLGNSTPDAKVSTSNGGGAVYSNNSAINIIKSEFDGNLSGYYGGALKLDACDTVMTDSAIRNSSGGTGGAVYATSGTFKAERLSLTGNTSRLNGVMFMTKNTAEFKELTASGNTSVNAGVVFASTNSDVTLQNSHITGNTAKYGGAVYVTGKATLSAANTEFTSNSSTSHGGAVYILGASFNASENTVFTENTAGAHGGAVSAHDEVKEGTLEKILSNVSLKNCSFTSNTGSNGGGVYFNDTEYEVADCTFTENTALSESYGGGAVYNTGAKGSISNVTFTGNKALRGGAVALYTNSEVSFSDITATGNEATEGGAIYSNRRAVNLTNGRTILKNNKASQGGAIFATSGPDIDIMNAEITGNTAEKNGGAVYVSGGTLDITGKDNIITNNNAGEYGGAVYASYVTVDDVKNGCVLNVTETDLTDNTALYGGAVAGRTNTVLNFTSMALRNNKTADATLDNSAGGGAVYINNATLNFSDVDIDSNMSGYYGGAVYAADADITMKDGTTVTGNTGGTGAAMYITSGSTLTADGLTLKDNTSSANGIIYMNGKSFVFNGLTATGNFSDFSGGALYFSGKSTKGEINNSHFENNEASSGGAVAVKGSTIEINDGTFIKNISDNTAGALLLQAGHAVINGNTVFEENTAASHGGAVYVTYSENDDKTKNPSSLTMNGGEFLKNSAFAGGAVSSRTDCTVSLTGTVLKENTVTSTENTEGGGAVFTNYNTLTLSGVTLEGNTSPYYGGAVTALGAEVTIKDNTVIKANLGKTGAAVNLRSGGTCTITDSSVTDHDVTGGSGVVYITGNGKLDIKGLTAENNINTNGAVIYSSGSATVNVSDSHFTSNTAKSIGGAIDHRSTGLLTVTDSEFKENTAKNGGAVHLEEGSSVITGCTFEKNSTTSVGGAVHSENATAEISDCTFTENSSASNGGAAYLKLSDVTLRNSTFTENTSAGSGGAIDLVAANLTATENNTFTRNSASVHAGAIYLTYISAVPPTETEPGTEAAYSTLNMADGIFTENTAMGGGAVSIRTGSEATFTSTQFIKNSVEGFDAGTDGKGKDDGNGEGGGAVYVGFGKLNLNNAVFTENTASGFGGAVDVLKSEVNVTGGTFHKNTANAGGAVYSLSTSELTFNGSAFTENESVYENTDYNNNLGGGAVNTNGGTLNLTGVTVEGNKTDYYGGGVMADGTVITINGNSIFRSNEGGTGAALYLKNKCALTASDLNVSANTAAKNGVIYANNTTLDITKLEATGNTASSGGVFYGSYKTVIGLKESTLSENTAKYGGAAFIESAEINMDGCTFSKNSSESTGGAIYLKLSRMSTKDSSYSENHATGNGGVVYNLASDVTGEGNNRFIKNSSLKHGGAFYNNYETVETEVEGTVKKEYIGSTAVISGGSFSENTALAGAAISIRSHSSADFTGTEFLKNSVAGYEVASDGTGSADGNGEGGGAVYVGYGTLTLTDCSFTENTAEGFGGAIDAVSADITVTGGSFNKNTANDGGAVYSINKSDITFNGTTLSENESTYANTDYNGSVGGGAVNMFGGTLTMTGVTLENNKTDYYGGAVMTSDVDVTIGGNSIIKGNTGSTGAALNFKNNSVVNISDTEITENTSNYNGVIYINTGSLTATNITATKNSGKNSALFYASNKKTVVTVTDSTLSENTAANGAVAYIDAATININGTEITDNSATANGGAVYLKENATAVLTDITASGNSAKFGGIVYADTADTVMNGGTFSRNEASESGGVLYLLNSEGTLTGVTATENGKKYGAVAYGENATLTVTASEITKNTGSTGGAVNLKENSVLTVTNTVISENTGTSGGAVYMDGGTASYEGVTVYGNTASGNGGALYHKTGIVAIKDSVFNGNTSAANGGAIMNSGSVITVTGNSEFTGNTAKAHGGAVYNTYIAKVPATDTTPEIPAIPSDFIMTDGKCIGNSALAGGVISIRTGCNASFTNTVLTDNTVTGFTDKKADGDGEGGGAVYVGYGTLSFNNVTASGNSANASVNDQDGTVAYGFGGVIDSYNSSVVINGGTFTGNSATAGGVVHALKSESLTVTGASFTGNSSVTSKVDAAAGGGAILVNDTALTVTGTTFDGNTTGYYGAAVHSIKSDVTINGNSVIKNHKGSTGAALYFRENSTAVIENTEITGNTSNGNGVIYINTGSLTANGVTATGNNGKNSALFYASNKSTTVTVTDSTLSGNTATNGGIAYIDASVLNISNTSITNNSATANGGAIYLKANAKAVLTAVTATGNSAESGGLIYAEESEATLTDCIVSGNEASESGGVLYLLNAEGTLTDVTATENGKKYGAVAYGENATLTVTDSEITKNTGSTGGAVNLKENSVLTVTNTVISENTGTSGGAIYMDGGTASYEGVTVSKNSATGNGGALYHKVGTVTIKDTVFTENTSAVNGGAIMNSGSVITVTGNSEFTGNTAKAHGGAVYNTYIAKVPATDTTPEIPAIPSDFIMTNGKCTGNSALAGGVISIRTGCNATFTNTVLTDNTVSGFADTANGDGEGGGAVYVGFGTLTFNNVTASGNKAEETINAQDGTVAYGFGGVIDSYNSSVVINGGTFLGNSASAGGAIHALNSDSITVTGATFKGNSSESTEISTAAGGGAILVNDTALTVTDTTFDGNTTSYYGAAVHSMDSKVTINGNSVIKNHEGTTGAALYLRDGSEALIENTEITDNTAKSNGVVYANMSKLTMKNVTASGNEAASGGVVFVSGNKTAEISDSTFTENTAKYGGALYTNGPDMLVTNCTLSDNTGFLGGALFAKLGEVTISGVTFENNKAIKNTSGSEGNGGAVNLTGGTLLTTGDNSFTGNTAEGFGGAIYNSYATNDDGTKTPGVVNMTNGSFTENIASTGGAVAARTDCISTFTGTRFINNSATSTVSGEGGGAIYGNNNTITLTGVTMDGNTTAYYGGAVLASDVDITINGGSIITNTSGKTGAVLCFRSGTAATLEDITISGNKTSSGSGLIYATNADTTITAKNITVSGNEGNHGIFYTSGSAAVTINDSVIQNNKATNNGGAINHHSTGLLSVTNTSFIGNTAKNGGAVSTEENGPALFTGCTFTGNTAAEKGGVLYLGGSKDVTFKGCTINGNSASVSGGAIYTNGTGKLIISESTSLSGNEAPNGGALHIDMGAVAEITGSSLKGNKATATSGSGGAVYITDLTEETHTAETTLVATNTVFEENIANSKGGAISTGTSAPNLRITANGCTFLKNSAATAGGGAVEIQNGNCTTADDPTETKIVFTSCTFTENTAKTTGAAVEIRTSSMAKFDGITATKNTASQNGAVFYVTSNHSRLYLTGTVTESENTAKSGNFAYLYNSSYTNPPRIYTSHSKSDATWYSGVKGNTTSVTFDVAVMP